MLSRNFAPVGSRKVSDYVMNPGDGVDDGIVCGRPGVGSHKTSRYVIFR